MASEADHRRWIKHYDDRATLFAKEAKVGCWITGIGVLAAFAGWDGFVITPDEFFGLGIVMALLGTGPIYVMRRDLRVAEQNRLEAWRAAKRDGVDL
jgi:hypothetical protein